MTKLKVLIVGGGVAGNTVAFWLSKLDHDVTLIERYPDLRSTGLQIDVRGHGVEVMKRMRLEKAFRANAVDEQGLDLVNRSGKTMAHFPVNRSGKGVQSFTTEHEIMRGDLVRILHDASKDGTRYIFGITVETLEMQEGSVEVTFSDGRKSSFDLVIGADGQGSRTRRMLLEPGTADPIHYLGAYIGYFTIPWPLPKGEEYKSTTYIANKWRFFLTRRSNPDRMQIYLSANEQHAPHFKGVRKGDVENEKEAFAMTFHGAGWQTDRILEGLRNTEDFYCERPGVVRLESWSSGRVVLVGDAAYSPTVMTGMGTSCGMVGAYILAGEIDRQCRNSSHQEDILKALEAYEKKFRPFMDQVQEGVVENRLWNFVPTTSFGIAILIFLLRLALFLRLDFLAMAIFKESISDWSLPGYDEMIDATSREK